ncbi:FAD-dependent monooxygenase, partial [Actinomadura fibrosa]
PPPPPELGLPFPTRSTVLSMILADVRLSDAPREIFRLKGVPDAFCFLAAFGDGWHRAVVCDPRVQPPLDAPVGLDEVRALTERVYGTDFGMSEARWISRFHSHERQVPRYRVGRAFLAGDAAHVHSPAGGQGMNLGMQDAANLSWKLAAAVRGRAPRGLLDSYENERHPVGRLVGRNSGILTRLTVELRSPILRALRNVAAHAATTARPINRRLAGLMSGVDLRYPAPPDAHPLTGRRAPDLPLAARPGGPARLYEALRAGRFVLVTGEPVPEPIEGVDVVAPARLMGTTLLVRPDGYIGWATGDFDLDGLREALRLWYAPPDSRS